MTLKDIDSGPSHIAEGLLYDWHEERGLDVTRWDKTYMAHIERLEGQVAGYKSAIQEEMEENIKLFAMLGVEAEIKEGMAGTVAVVQAIKRLQQQLQTAREALRFYADPQTYGIGGGSVGRAIQDRGQQALAALEGKP